MEFLRRLFGFEQRRAALRPGRGWTVPVVGEASYQGVLQTLYRKNGGNEHDIKSKPSWCRKMTTLSILTLYAPRLNLAALVICRAN